MLTGHKERTDHELSLLILKSRNQYYMYDFVTKHYTTVDKEDQGILYIAVCAFAALNPKCRSKLR